MSTVTLDGVTIAVREYIWKKLNPPTLGSPFGGVVSSVTLPFYLYLIVVERKRKKLSVFTYEACEKPSELNFDPTFFKISLREREDFVDVDELNLLNTGSATISDIDYHNEKNGHHLYRQAKSYSQKIYLLDPLCYKHCN